MSTTPTRHPVSPADDPVSPADDPAGRGHQVTDAAELLRMYGPVPKRAAGKVHGHVDQHDRDFIARSPFLVLATAASDGLLDVSPRGDLPGFVRVLDDQHLVLPDRPGNNRIDSLLNLLTDPRLSLIFLVPGLVHTLRVNGTAVVSTDPGLRELCEVKGRLPVTTLLMQVHEVLYQCPRALVRGRLWDPERHVDPRSLPTLDEVLADQVTGLTQAESVSIGRASVDDPLW
jgi:PPOX class probable FMN-dependent enzyme